MVSDFTRKKAIRERMAATGENYTTAARAVAGDAEGASATAAVALAIDPALLVPYPDELVRPADADERWQPTTVDELGWRALPVGATPAQRARAESVWRPVTADRLCRCAGRTSGVCLHGAACDSDGVGGCAGRLVHHDRLAASMLSLDGWYDIYACDTCGEQFEASVELFEVPWGEVTDTGTWRQFDGVRRITFHDGDPDNDQCPECHHDPCRCDEAYCEECGADSNYTCSCYELAR